MSGSDRTRDAQQQSGLVPLQVVGASELKPGFETFANEVDFVGMVIRTSRLNTFDRQRYHSTDLTSSSSPLEI